MDEFLSVMPKYLGTDILVKEERNGRPSSRVKDDEKSIAKMEFKSALFRVKETKEELEQLHKISEEEVRVQMSMSLVTISLFWLSLPAQQICCVLTYQFVDWKWLKYLLRTVQPIYILFVPFDFLV